MTKGQDLSLVVNSLYIYIVNSLYIYSGCFLVHARYVAWLNVSSVYSYLQDSLVVVTNVSGGDSLKNISLDVQSPKVVYNRVLYWVPKTRQSRV